MGQEGTQGDVGLSKLWDAGRVETGWEEGYPSALGDPSPRLDFASNWQISPAARDGMGRGSTGKDSVCPTRPLPQGQDLSPPQQPFQKGNAGSCQHGLGTLEQPGLGPCLVLSFGGHYGPWSKSSGQAGLGHVTHYRGSRKS